MHRYVCCINKSILLGLDMRKYEGQLPPFLHAVEQKALEPIFGIYIPNGGKKGEITFGGVNEAHLKKDTAVSVKIEAGGQMYIKMKKFMLGDIEACKENDASCKALVDTGCTDILGPKNCMHIILIVKSSFMKMGYHHPARYKVHRLTLFRKLELNNG